MIVNADDFGFTRGVNQGIVEAHTRGILTATTLMAEGRAFEHAVELARANPTLDVGVHLVLWPDGDLPQRLPSFLRRALSLSTVEVEALFAAQIQKVMAAGITPSHLDTHKHTHILPHVWKAMVAVAERFKIRWIRSRLLPGSRRPATLRHTDHFVGVRLTGKMTQSSLSTALSKLRPGVTELMCHPGHCDADLEAAPTRLKWSRQVELEALTAPETRALLVENGVELTNFRQCP